MKNSLYEVIFYETPSGQVPVDDFLDLCQTKVRAKVPPLEIKRAENYMAEFLNRHQGAN